MKSKTVSKGSCRFLKECYRILGFFYVPSAAFSSNVKGYARYDNIETRSIFGERYNLIQLIGCTFSSRYSVMHTIEALVQVSTVGSQRWRSMYIHIWEVYSLEVYTWKEIK